MHLESLRSALGACIGQTLTPDLCAAIERRARIVPDNTINPRQFPPTFAGNYVLRVERFEEVLDELRPMHDQHWLETEAHRHGVPLQPNYEAMAADSLAGQLLQFTVRREGVLVGNLRLYVRPSRHTLGRVASEDTLYIAPEHRDSMLGLKLLRYAENCLIVLGVESIEANSKLVNRADVLLRRMRYSAVATMFYKYLKA